MISLGELRSIQNLLLRFRKKTRFINLFRLSDKKFINYGINAKKKFFANSTVKLNEQISIYAVRNIFFSGNFMQSVKINYLLEVFQLCIEDKIFSKSSNYW
jgi:hypothetical protein